MYRLLRPKTRWGCAVWFILGLLGLLLCIAFLLMYLWSARERRGRSLLAQRLETMQAQGIPIDNDSLSAEYRSNTISRNSQRWIALLDEFEGEAYRKSLAETGYFDRLDEIELEPSGEWQSDEPLRQLLTRHAGLIDAIVTLSSDQEAVQFPIKFESEKTLLTYTQGTSNASRALLYRGFIAIRDRDSERLAQTIDAMLGLAKVCSAEPFFVSKLVCARQTNNAVSLLKLGIENHCFESSALEDLLPRFLEASQMDRAWQEVIRGERAAMIPTFQAPRAATKFPSYYYSMGWDCLHFLDLFDKAEQLDTSNIDSLLAAGDEMTKEIEALRRSNWLTQRDALLTLTIVPAFREYSASLATKLVLCRLAVIAIKIELFRLSTHRLPNDLNELELDMTELMPPGGKPFGYKLDSQGTATLWGFSLTGDRAQSSTPMIPPDLSSGSGQSGQAKAMVWRFR
jgi:hypothetical protein